MAEVYNITKILIMLSDLNRRWSDDFILFAQNGLLLLVRADNGLILADFSRIQCDGGDAKTRQDEQGNEYLVR